MNDKEHTNWLRCSPSFIDRTLDDNVTVMVKYTEDY